MPTPDRPPGDKNGGMSISNDPKRGLRGVCFNFRTGGAFHLGLTSPNTENFTIDSAIKYIFKFSTKPLDINKYDD